MARKKRTYNIRLIKATLSSSVRDIAELFGTHRRTILAWLKQGLPKIDDRKPYLILGADLAKFLTEKQNRRKRKCDPTEFYCFKCREPRQSKGNKAEINILNTKKAMLIGRCSFCNTKLNRLVSGQKIQQFQELFIIVRVHNKHLIGFDAPSLNTHIREVVKNEQVQS